MDVKSWTAIIAHQIMGFDQHSRDGNPKFVSAQKGFSTLLRRVTPDEKADDLGNTRRFVGKRRIRRWGRWSLGRPDHPPPCPKRALQSSSEAKNHRIRKNRAASAQTRSTRPGLLQESFSEPSREASEFFRIRWFFAMIEGVGDRIAGRRPHARLRSTKARIDVTYVEARRPLAPKSCQMLRHGCRIRRRPRQSAGAFARHQFYERMA